MTTTRRPSRGFTLIEVLMAAFVIALGSLGLIALFAGSAGVQIASARLTTSVTLSKNAEAVLRTKVSDLSTDASLGCAPPTFNNDAWYPLPSDDEFGYLTLTRYDDLNSPALFFQVPLRQRDTTDGYTLYRAQPIGADNYMLFGSPGFTNSRSVALPWGGGSPGFGGARGGELPDRRVKPDTVRVTFELYSLECGGTTGRELLLDDTTAPALGFNFSGAGCDENIVFSDGTSFVGNNPVGTYIEIDVESNPVNGRDPARFIGFFIDQLQAPTNPVMHCYGGIDVAMGEDAFCTNEGGILPCFEVYVIDRTNLTGAGGQLVYDVADPLNAEFSIIPTADVPVVATPSGNLHTLRNVNPAMIDGENANLRLEVGRIALSRTDGTLINPGDGYLTTGPNIAGSAGNALFTTDQTLSTDGMPIGTLVPLRMPSVLVKSVSIDYDWRADELVSLRDRLVFTPDPQHPEGERPEMGYSVLYRSRSGLGSDQFCVFTYALAPATTTARWFPPENPNEIANGEAPLRLARGMELTYIASRNQYVLTSPPGQLDEYSWLAQPGQLLLFAGSSGNETVGPGADTIVRATSAFIREDGIVVMELDRPPRFNGQTLLRIHEGDSASGDFDVWAVQPIVTSKDDGLQWTLTPVEARIFQAGGGS